jgi:beta-mannanase
MAALILALASTTPSLAARSPIALGISEPNWSSMDAVDQITATLGRAPVIWSVWSDWGDTSANSNAPFPSAVVAGLKQRGIIPQVYWEPLDPSNQFDCEHWSLRNIINGDHDAYIRQWALDAKASGSTIILRFAHEMNGYWYPWGTGNGGGICNNTTTQFRQAWIHVWKIFRGTNGVGATNVKFEYSIINTKQVAADYPGGKYVDYLGLTALDWAKKRKWNTLQKRMGPAMKALRNLSTTKPIIASEIAAGYNPNCAICDKVAFFTQGYPAVYEKWPQLVAIVYFDYDMRSVGQDDWRLSSPPEALEAYKGIVADPRFQGTLP